MKHGVVFSMEPRNQLPNYVYLYFSCQSINLITAVISVAIAASVGVRISSNPMYATIPYGTQFLLLLMGTYPASIMMKKYGRKLGFHVGAIFLLFSGITGFFAVVENSFVLLVISHGLIGLFTACANFYRYAVTDGLPEILQPRAISLVVAGGVIAGIIGPAISSQLKDAFGFPAFSLCYASLIIFSLINLVFIYFLPDHEIKPPEVIKDVNDYDVRKQNFVYASIFVAACGYGLMNLMMIQSSLKMDQMQIEFNDAAFAIQWHVVAMFFPSFFTGSLISKLGHLVVTASGYFLFILSFLINLFDSSYINVTVSLVLLGLGWNFTYVGGSSMLAANIAKSRDKQRWQGIGDTAIAVFAMIGAMSPSFLLNQIGWEISNILSIGICLVPIISIILLKKSSELV